MELRREVLIGIGALIALLIAVSFSALGTLTRISPRLEAILGDNLVSVELAQEVLVALASVPDGPVPAADRERISRHVAALQDNCTEPGEELLVRGLADALGAVFAGEEGAMGGAVRYLHELIRVNQARMKAVHDDTRRLDAAGPWAVVALSLFSFLLALIVIKRLFDRVVLPLEELHSVLVDARTGLSRRRCGSVDASREIQQIQTGVNLLLDRGTGGQDAEVITISPVDRFVATALMDRLGVPAWVVHQDGRIMATNQDGMDALQGDAGKRLRDDLARVGEGSGPLIESHEWDTLPLPDRQGSLVIRARKAPCAAEDRVMPGERE